MKLVNNKGITLIALVITIIILLILAGITIATLTGENGILSKAENAKYETTRTGEEEQIKIAYSGVMAEKLGAGEVFAEDLNEQFKQNSTNATAEDLENGDIKVTFKDTLNQYIIDKNGKITRLDEKGEVHPEDGSYDIIKHVNSPKLVTGMTKIMFTEPTTSDKGETIKDGESGFDNKNWYDYYTKKWANVVTKDGSMWVWIPRFAYKINYNDSNDKSKGGTFDVKFLIDTTDEYYDENGNRQTAKRVKTSTEIADTTNYYYVHPAFTNESSINFRNGGWDKELEGIWVAKFEAAYPSGNNEAPVKLSSQNYTLETSYIRAVEAGATSDGNYTARNWLDGIYGTTTTSIKYPTFQGASYGMVYINHNDSFNIARSLTESGNIYGLTSSTDSHLMKDSEWGAIAYLGQSQYGLNGTNIAINNINLNSGNQKRTITTGENGVDSVYAVTGVTDGTEDGAEKVVAANVITNINNNEANTPNDGVYTWNQVTGQKASSTGNIYGIYDLSGGSWEKTAGYVANGNSYLKMYGASIAYNGNTLKTTSTKYITVYNHDVSKDNTTIETTSENLAIANKANYLQNTKIYGDAIHETSTDGIGSSSWYNGYSAFPGLHAPFMAYGGHWSVSSNGGLFSFGRTNGYSAYGQGFRAVLVAE